MTTVSFTAPYNGGSTITGYTATATPGGMTGTCAASPCIVTGLTNGTAYTFTVTATNAIGTGAASAASNSVIPLSVPDAPTGVTAAGGNIKATVTFIAPAYDGASPITGYTVTSFPAGGVDSNAGTTSLSHVITGLVNGTAYTFTVTATNAIGTGPVSAASNSVTPAPVVPDAPANVAAAGGDGQAAVTFTAPFDGGSSITNYTVTSHPGSITASGTASPITVTGLTNGTAYNFTVTATNAVGESAASAPSNTIVAMVMPMSYYIYDDQLDTPRVITDTNGNVVWRWDNADPFGANMANENPNGAGQFSFNLRFPGQYYDRETNLHYNINRDYDPAIGRYVQSDPIGLQGGINTYTYVLGNPLLWVDPLGLDYIVVEGGSSGTATYYDNNNNPVVQMPYRSGSGPNKEDPTANGQGRTPPGTYNIEQPPVNVPSSQAHQQSYYDKFGNCWWDPYVPQFPTPNHRCLPKLLGGDGRCGMHPDGAKPGTQGCTGLTSDNTDPFRKAIQNYSPSPSNPLPVYVK